MNGENPETNVGNEPTPQNPSTGESQGTEVSWINPDGTFGDLSQAPEDVRSFIETKGYKAIDGMIKSQKELESFVGQRDQLITIPDENDTEGWNEVHTKLGRPAKPEDYKFEPSEEEKNLVNENLLGLFKEYAHQQGMNQKAFENTVRFQLDATKAEMQAYAEEQNNAQKAIRERFNTEDEYNQFTQKALGFAEGFKLDDGKSVADVIENYGLAHDPVVLDMLGQLADRVAEDPLPTGETRVPQSQPDKLKAIKENPAFTNAAHPDHEKVMQEYWGLFLHKEG